MAQVSYTVLEPLTHNGQPYAVGATVKLDAETAKMLIVSGVVADKAKA